MKLALIDLGLIWIIVLGGVMMTDVVKHYNDNRTDSPVQNDNTRGKTLFEYIVLETVKTKILMKLGLRSPPKIEHETAAILRDDATFLPLAQHDAAVARSASVAKKLDREFGEHSKVVIFAELGTFNQCDVPKNLFTKSFTALSFKLTKPPTFFGQGILWYRPNERKNSRSHIRIWTCSCNTTRFWNPYPSNPNVREMNKTLDGCQLLSQHDWDKKDGTATPIRKGWSHVHLTDNWTSVISNLTDSEFRVLFVLDGKVRIGANKRPFLVLDGITEVPNKSQRDAVHHSRNDCLLPQVETQNCCRANYWIDVEKLGWSDWILSPKGFYFHHCVGNCNGGFNHINNNSLLEYSDVLNAYMKRIKFNIRPCCVPKTLSHLPIVITTDGQTINRTYVPHFVVENCSCFGFSKYD